MRRSPWRDPYLAVLQRFNRLGVRYVVIGMAGINYYAKSPAEAFASMDYDLFVDPTLRNVGQALQGLRALGFQLATAEGPFRDDAVKQLVRDQRTVVATTPDGLMVELLLKVSGYPFSELARDAATFTVRGVPVRVGRLRKLLRSKYLAGRPKDRQFLRRYWTQLEE